MVHNFKFLTKPLSKAVSNVFKLIYFQIENSDHQSKFLSNYNKFWILQNVDPVIKNINIISRKNKVKSIATFDLSAMSTTLPHEKLIKRFCNVIDLVFEGGNRTHTCISKNNVAYCGKKSTDNKGFNKSPLKTSLLKHLIQSSYFMVGNSLLRQKIGIPMEIDQAPFCANLFLYTYENEYMSELISNDIKARHFHATKRFIDDYGTLKDGGAFSDVFKDIYLPELQLKIEHAGICVTFLDLDITVVFV